MLVLLTVISLIVIPVIGWVRESASIRERVKRSMEREEKMKALRVGDSLSSLRAALPADCAEPYNNSTFQVPVIRWREDWAARNVDRVTYQITVSDNRIVTIDRDIFEGIHLDKIRPRLMYYYIRAFREVSE